MPPPPDPAPRDRRDAAEGWLAALIERGERAGSSEDAPDADRACDDERRRPEVPAAAG